MKVVDFIRKFGWEKAKECLEFGKNYTDSDIRAKHDDLKTYVDAWELVQKMGGTIDEIKEHVRVTERNLKRGVYFKCTIERNINRINRIKKAIALVEEVCGG